MISHLRGRLARKNEPASSVELDVGGVWYEVELPAFVWRALEDTERTGGRIRGIVLWNAPDPILAEVRAPEPSAEPVPATA